MDLGGNGRMDRHYSFGGGQNKYANGHGMVFQFLFKANCHAGNISNVYLLLKRKQNR